MDDKVLGKNGRESLAEIGKSDILNGAYLAGGTALALRLGHRVSHDFDFFTSENFEEKVLVQRLLTLPTGFKVERLSWGTILGYIGESRFSLFFYDYPLIDAADDFLGIKIAGIKDIAAMKLAAISDRGAKRDFIDLYFIIAKERLFTLADAFDFYDRKFKNLGSNAFHMLKSLNYFEDAETEEEPKMFLPVIWSEVKKFFESETEKLGKKMLT